MGTFLDPTDIAIIRLLQTDGRLTNREISEHVGTSEATVRRRVDRLIASKTIQVVALADWRALGYKTVAFIGLKVELPRRQAIIDHLVSLSQVRFVAPATGAFDLVIEVVLRSDLELHQFISKTLAVIDGVRTIETSLLPEYAKRRFDYFLPEVPWVDEGTDGGQTANGSQSARPGAQAGGG